jgi:hypothetical protein
MILIGVNIPIVFFARLAEFTTHSTPTPIYQIIVKATVVTQDENLLGVLRAFKFCRVVVQVVLSGRILSGVTVKQSRVTR